MADSEPRPHRLKVALFGAGARGLQCLATIGRDPRFDITAFFDNDPKKWQTTIEGLPVLEPTTEACADVDAIIIASVYAREIFAQLTRLGVAGKVALSPPQLARRFAGDPAPVVDDASGADPRQALLALAPEAIRALAEEIDGTTPPRPTPGQAASTEVACTICCNNYLAFATVLARSFLRHHPGGRFFICLVDRRRDEIAYPEDDRITVLEAGALGIPEFDTVAFKYDVLEFNTAVKPYLLERLLRDEGVERLLYLDPDILVLSPLDELFDELSRTPLVLTPHLTQPYTDDRHPREIDILRAGTFNLGFVGVAAHPQTWELLAWWQTRLYDGCTREVEKGYFVDQKWMDFAPSFFPEHRVVRDPGYNAAYWNLHERALTRHDGRFEVNGRPLRFYHFSGVDVHDLESVSRHQNRVTLPDEGALRDLFELYRVLLVSHGHLELRSTPYSYGRFDNGVRIPDVVRAIYRESRLTGVYPRPFASAGPESFYAWLRAPWRSDSFISNLFATLHARTPELRAAFPTIGGDAELGLLLHLSSAADLYGLPSELVDDGPERLAGRLDLATTAAPAPPRRTTPTRTLRSPAPSRQAAQGRPPVDETPLHARVHDDPHPETSALFSEAIRAAVREATSDSRHADRDDVLVIGRVALDTADAAREARLRPDIAYWMWDESWPSATSHEPVTEIWTPSCYSLEGLSRRARVPVVDMPLPIGVVTPSHATRDSLGFGDQATLFVTVLDRTTRRGHDPADSARAFRDAFACGDGSAHPMLVIGVTAAEEVQDVQQRVAPFVTAATPIEVRALATDDMVQLLRLSDCYVSLHDRLAFDVWMAHALWYGRPAVTTHASGSTEIANVNNSFLVGMRRHSRGLRPDLEHAAAMLRLTTDARGERRDRGAHARRDLRASHDVTIVASRIEKRLRLVAARRRATVPAGAA